jgi:hypothetical protein
VPDPGRDHDHVPGPQFQRLAGLTAKPHARPPCRDAQHLVAGAVEVVVGEDPVAPGAQPAIAGEPPFGRIGEVGAA